MTFVSENKNLFTMYDVKIEKKKLTTIRNLKAILSSPKREFIFDLFIRISQGDNYTECWGGVSYDKKNLEALIDKLLSEKWVRNSNTRNCHYFDNFFFDVCIPVLDLLIENDLIEIEGYSIDLLSESMLLNESVVIKKGVKKGFSMRLGKIKAFDIDRCLIAFEDCEHYFKQKDFLFIEAPQHHADLQ